VYQQPALRLAWVAADAQSLAEIFPPRAQPLFTKVETRLFKDADATRGNLVQSLARLRKRS
jgi:hypothetical protein